MELRDLPGRVATGAYILHAGIEKWAPDPDRAKGLHGMASGAFPFLRTMPADRFMKALSISELSVGGLLLAPFIRRRIAGLALTAFSGGLVTMYLRTPGVRQEGSVWPTRDGIALSKDVWMLGIGLGLLAPTGTDD
ncbi:hypothetical protein ACPPVT_01400 [Angustibacter sp. McL0619]|uniref:hypothetical protein n=1 Tax=Angustibacter sp. McL0619 TaxID=3415676 RepID=UPI003CE8D33F